MSVIDEEVPAPAGNGGNGPPQVGLTATGDPTPPASTPLILNDGYFELTGVNLRCLVKHLEVAPEVKKVTVTTFCNETDYPGVVKWHLRCTLYQDFSTGSTFATLNSAYNAYVASGTPAVFKARPYSSRVAAANNPIISGYAIPEPFMLIGGDAGAASEVAVDWNLTTPPTIDNGAVVATGAVAGSPGYFTPSGATSPANLAALTGITASPSTNWTTGQFVITADLLANNWNGTTWVAGKHA
jgi:hypothetical protein